jgi:hypothetical protein
MLYNPLRTVLEREIQLPLYYTGLTRHAKVREPDGRAKRYTLDRRYRITVPVRLPAQGYTWLVIEAP